MADQQDLSVVSMVAGETRVALRQRLPLMSSAVVESCLGDGRFIVRNADSEFSLKLFQRELYDQFTDAQKYNDVKEVPFDKIEIGEMYLYCVDRLNVLRVTVLSIREQFALCRFIDYGIVRTCQFGTLYTMDADSFEEVRSLKPFITRVNLLPDDILRTVGLPTSAMIRVGDFVDVTVLTTTEPHLGAFGFTRSATYKVLPKNLISGFNNHDQNNWLSLFDNKSMSAGATLLLHGFGQLREREFHSNRLVLIAYAKSLDKVYVYDIESSLRMPLIRERMQMLYGVEEIRKGYVIDDLSMIKTGIGCVAFHEFSKSYVRVEVVALGSDQVEVAPIDSPNFGLFTVKKSSLLKIPKSLQFPRQTFSVRLVRESDGQLSNYLSSMARCVLPSMTPVVLNSETKFGLVTIQSPAAPKGVLSKIGFFDLEQDKFAAHKTVDTRLRCFDDVVPTEIIVPGIDDIKEFAENLGSVV